MNLDDTLRLHALKLKAGNSNSRLVEMALENAQDAPEIKQMCAKVSVALSDEIDQVCTLLDMPKRQFIELACIDALEKAHKHLEETGALDALQQRSL
jgi:hypothetical protein